MVYMYMLILIMVTILGGFMFGDGTEGISVPGICRLIFVLPATILCLIPAALLLLAMNEADNEN